MPLPPKPRNFARCHSESATPARAPISQESVASETTFRRAGPTLGVRTPFLTQRNISTQKKLQLQPQPQTQADFAECVLSFAWVFPDSEFSRLSCCVLIFEFLEFFKLLDLRPLLAGSGLIFTDWLKTRMNPHALGPEPCAIPRWARLLGWPMLLCVGCAPLVLLCLFFPTPKRVPSTKTTPHETGRIGHRPGLPLLEGGAERTIASAASRKKKPRPISFLQVQFANPG